MKGGVGVEQKSPRTGISKAYSFRQLNGLPPVSLLEKFFSLLLEKKHFPPVILSLFPSGSLVLSHPPHNTVV